MLKSVFFKKLWLLDSGIHLHYYMLLKIYLCAVLGSRQVVDYCLQFPIPFLIVNSVLFHKLIYWLWSGKLQHLCACESTEIMYMGWE